ncbi:CAHM6 protein, partial [Crypturellus soui]|nr:CAHM6 protein [Crypturellus soui]
MEKLQPAVDFCLRHQTALGYSVVSLLTAISEHIFAVVVFRCPCNSWNTFYGSVFLLVPAVILFLLGLIMNTRVLLLLTGCCSQDRWCDCNLKGKYVLYIRELGPAAARALVAPVTWIAVALLSASFYECAASGSSLMKELVCKGEGKQCPKLLARIPCDQNVSEKLSDEVLSLRTQSQIIGWLLISAVMALTVISTCLSHCCSPVSFLHLKFWQIYSKKEQELFQAKAEEHAAKLAERNVNFFFEATGRMPFRTPSHEAWQKISSLNTLRVEELHYSAIHRYA